MVEYQAIARVFRLGQERNVRVVRYIMKGTVEEVCHISTELSLLLTREAGNATSADTKTRIRRSRVER